MRHSVEHSVVNALQSDMEPGQDFWPVTPLDPVACDPLTQSDQIRSLSIVKQILDNGLIVVSVRKPKPFSGLIYTISWLSEFVLLE